MDCSIPTESDWRSEPEPWAADTKYAYEQFSGKTFDQAFELFEENALNRQEDLAWMPRACFVFYVQAYAAYLLTNASQGDCDGASCFLNLVESRSADIRSDPKLRASIEHCVNHLSKHQKFFDADVSIYGNFTERAQEVLKKLRR